MMDFLVSSCEQHPMLRDGTVLRSSAVTIGTRLYHISDGKFTTLTTWANLATFLYITLN